MGDQDSPVFCLLTPDPLLPGEKETVGLSVALEDVPQQGEGRHHHGPADVTEAPNVHLGWTVFSELLVDINKENLLVPGYQVHQERLIGVGEEQEVCPSQSIICFLNILVVSLVNIN